MTDLERLAELIDQIPQIEKCFSSTNIGLFTHNDWRTRQSNTIYVPDNTIYNSPEFKKWRDEILQIISNMKQDKFLEEIINICNSFKGYGDKNKFENLRSKLIVLKGNLAKYEMDYSELLSDKRIPEADLLQRVLHAMIRLQANHTYTASCKEDTMNDYVRDMLSCNYTVKDQTRQGDSANGKDAGEIDIQICKKNLPLVMIEALKLNSLAKDLLDSHINKVLTNYDPNGCPYAFVLVYVTAARFADFYNKMLNYLREYNFPYDRKTDIQDIDTGYSELRHAHTVLQRNEKYIKLHFFAVHITSH